MKSHVTTGNDWNIWHRYDLIANSHVIFCCIFNVLLSEGHYTLIFLAVQGFTACLTQGMAFLMCNNESERVFIHMDMCEASEAYTSRHMWS